MKKSLTRILIVILALLIIVVIIFWGRFQGAYTVYKLATEFIEGINQGRPALNLHIAGNWGSMDRPDSLDATVSYQQDQHFLADVHLNQNQYRVLTEQDQTVVQISKSNLLISGKGPEQPNFDLLLLCGEIFQNHPWLNQIKNLNWCKRVGLAIVSFFKCDFRKTTDYQIIGFPQQMLQTNLELWHNRRTGTDIRIVAGDSVKPVNLIITSEAKTYTAVPIDTASFKKIAVTRPELNTAIYRGAVRTVGILLENMMPPPVDGKERIWGKGLLTYVNGNRVLIAKGTYREIGEAHGALLTKEARKMADATLYTICWFYTMERGRWFIDDLRDAYRRLEPFIPQKYQEEMAGLAATSNITLDEIRLTNVFPELFHCSGFALFNQATVDGKLYHGRVLDYMTELGLQYHAVVYILHPEGSNSFANVGYAGFIGSVSGMNEQQVAFGEMGGRGEGDWDGMPMGFLMREGLEQAKTLDEALAIFRDTPRTCEYYYVISDGKIPDARGLATSPKRFEIIEPNKFHQLLPHPIEDAVLMSAGDRYQKLVERVKENYGKIDAEKAIHLMDRPVAMKSNLHNVLFAPQSLEFWVAHAGSKTPAAKEPYTHYSMKELLGRLEELAE